MLDSSNLCCTHSRSDLTVITCITLHANMHLPGLVRLSCSCSTGCPPWGLPSPATWHISSVCDGRGLSGAHWAIILALQ